MQERKQYKISLPMTEKQKNNVEELLNKLANFSGVQCTLEEIENSEEVQEEKEWPQDGDAFCFIDSDGDIINEYFDSDDSACKKMLLIGNCFKTKEEAEFELERLKVLAEMKKFAEPKDRKWNSFNEHWFIYYQSKFDDISYDFRLQNKFNSIYFESEEKVKECVKAVGEDRIKKFYLRVKE